MQTHAESVHKNGADRSSIFLSYRVNSKWTYSTYLTARRYIPASPTGGGIITRWALNIEVHNSPRPLNRLTLTLTLKLTFGLIFIGGEVSR